MSQNVLGAIDSDNSKGTSSECLCNRCWEIDCESENHTLISRFGFISDINLFKLKSNFFHLISVPLAELE